MTMLIAGHHSLSIVLSWALYQIAAHPDVQRCMQTEIDALGHMPSTLDDLDGIPFTRGVFLEALRLYPQPPILLREALCDHRLGDFDVRRGDQLIIDILAVHADERLWPEPQSFQPDRYRDFDVDAMMQQNHLGFGGGPRSCIGRRFAMAEGCAILACVAKSLSLHPVAGPPVLPRFAGMLVPSRPLRLRVALRT